ncbi:MAG: hypothetical protein F6K32_05440 [Desertifilum sp. SIO1I2]|nr:hypothetical protein [Desertifilum sp. SIO1I2]
MSSPTARKDSNSPPTSRRVRLRKPPLLLRRLGAWVVEVTLISSSAIAPYAMGEYARTHSETQVPLNPVLSATQDNIAQTLAIPITQSDRTVAPITNLLWSVALAAPIAVAAWQLYLLGSTGKTSPKRWLGVRVIGANGAPPGVVRAFVREAVGRWGLPLGIAYSIWRYSGAFPDLGILTGLAGFFLLAECAVVRFNRYHRAFHDRLAGTFVLSESQRKGRGTHFSAEVDETPTLAAIVLTPEAIQRRSSLWYWMREHPGLTLLIAILASLSAILGTFVGTQIYIQTQANRREFQQQDNQLFLELVGKLNADTTPGSASALSSRREAILALGTVGDRRARQFLVDLLSQEQTPENLEPIQQALVSSGPEALPFLQRLNQALKAQLDSIQPTRNPTPQAQILTRRLQATQSAIAKILTVYSGQTAQTDLSRTHLGQISAPMPFTLVLDNLDLSGINFRNATLEGGSFRNSRFYGPGPDSRIGTYDDWIADLSGADLKETDFTGANLARASLSRASLLRATLNGANLTHTRLDAANLSSAQLTDASLESANLAAASLVGADLANANLTFTNLQKARLAQIQGNNAQFQHAELTQTDWQGADLANANFTQAKLNEADLSNTQLSGANLRNTQLRNASFRGANLSFADFRGANVEGVDFQGAVFQQTPTASPASFIEKAPTSGDRTWQGVNLTQAQNLEPVQLEYLCQQGAIHPQCP